MDDHMCRTLNTTYFLLHLDLLRCMQYLYVWAISAANVCINKHFNA